MAQKKKKRAHDKSAKSDAKNAKPDEGGGEYEFPMPEFDEKAFMRREMESAKTTFWTAGVGIGAGLLAWLAHINTGDYRLGFLVIVLGGVILGPLLRKLGFSEDATSKKSLFGNWFFLFFTALAVWVLALNV